MKMLCILAFVVYMATAQVNPLTRDLIIDNTFIETFAKKFTEKFSCFFDQSGVHQRFHLEFYGNENCQQFADQDAGNPAIDCADFYCCGYMANGLQQCDIFDNWSMIGQTHEHASHFSLCETSYDLAVAPTRNIEGNDRPNLRRDLCCDNDYFSDCALCHGFMVWDWTVSDENGGDLALENSLSANEACMTEDNFAGEYCEGRQVTMDQDWRKKFNSRENQHKYYPEDDSVNGISYPPYAYTNDVYPAGYARGKLREYNDPPICVYAPNVAGRVIEIKVEPDETGNDICVDDLHEDQLERNAPGVTQACDNTRLRTCFPDASTDTTLNAGFAFLISCSESCADGDVDLWFRVRASVNKWTDQGDESKGTTSADTNTEMWCMWGVQNMQDEEGGFSQALPDGLEDLSGDFSKWDIWPSDLTPESEPRVQPIEGSSAHLSLIFAFLLLAFAL